MIHPSLDCTVASEELRPKFNAHVQKWEGCGRCPLGDTAHHHVLTRGELPCDVLMIGEAPGPDENLLGKPFIGPAGDMLNRLIKDAHYKRKGTVWTYTYCISNLLACFPYQNSNKQKFRSPSAAESQACSPRLVELIQMAQPISILLLGKYPWELAPPTIKTAGFKGRVTRIYHPSYVMRQGGLKSTLYREWKGAYRRFLELTYQDGQKKKVH